MVERSANYQDFLVLVPCCAVLLILALVVGAVFLALHMMGTPQQQGQEERRP